MGYKETYDFWCTDAYFDEATKQELLSIADNEKEIEDRFYRDLEFGTGFVKLHRVLQTLLFLKTDRIKG